MSWLTYAADGVMVLVVIMIALAYLVCVFAAYLMLDDTDLGSLWLQSLLPRSTRLQNAVKVILTALGPLTALVWLIAYIAILLKKSPNPNPGSH